jgi:exodeoxyribonuclease V gamma subunit
MPLEIYYVRNLSVIVEPVVEYLSRSLEDPFTRQQIIVPTAGVKAWLTAELATRLGKTVSSELGDGILANVLFSYPAAIGSLDGSDSLIDQDPWEVERLTFSILDVLDEYPKEFGELISRAGGPLLAARRIADRLDHYHFRRSGMVQQWEEGKCVLAPYADTNGQRIEPELPAKDHWQFRIWSSVRRRFDGPSPFVRRALQSKDIPNSIMIAGLQGLTLGQIEVLKRLAEGNRQEGIVCDVKVYLIHPSPSLRLRWSQDNVIQTPGLAPSRQEAIPTSNLDSMVDGWLRGTRESQTLLASQGIRPMHREATWSSGNHLLGKLQATIERGQIAERFDFACDDVSLRVHRCHELRRQAEVLHDAILHAFRELENLAPHEVVIVSPKIAQLAPHLEVAFSRRGDNEPAGGNTPVLPLVIADRGICEISRGAELLIALLSVAGTRASVEDMLAVLTHPLVIDHFDVDSDCVAIWKKYIDRTGIRWGIDADRRSERVKDFPNLVAHTWKHGIERMLLGALTPDGDPVPLLGDVVPLDGMHSAELIPLTLLGSILSVLDEFDQETSQERTVGQWCDKIELAITQLTGDGNNELIYVLRELNDLRRNSITCNDRLVPFFDVSELLIKKMSSTVGRQPLWTGAITATSMIPLRGVPFRVICVAGFDPEAIEIRDFDYDDLVTRQSLIGDPDPKLDLRRSLLDCVMSASDRLIITCNGMSLRNNEMLPLATPLAELVDFASRHGVNNQKYDEHTLSQIEVVHPRHAYSSRNFTPGGVLGQGPWGHNALAKVTAESLGKSMHYAELEARDPQINNDLDQQPITIDLDSLARFMVDTLDPYVRKTLDINTWRDQESFVPAMLPFTLDKNQTQRLRNDYLNKILKTNDPTTLRTNWIDSVQKNGDVPVLGFGTQAVNAIVQFNEALVKLAKEKDVPLDQGEPIEIHLHLGHFEIRGAIERWYPSSQTLVIVKPDAMKSDQFKKPRMLATAQLLAICASKQMETQPNAYVFSQHGKWKPNVDKPLPAQLRKVDLARDITSEQANAILKELCTLYCQALRRPFGQFGETSKILASNPQDRTSAEDKFHEFMSARNREYALEWIVFGQRPQFDDVFPEGCDELLAFFRRHMAFTQFPPRSNTYQPL